MVSIGAVEVAAEIAARLRDTEPREPFYTPLLTVSEPEEWNEKEARPADGEGYAEQWITRAFFHVTAGDGAMYSVTVSPAPPD